MEWWGNIGALDAPLLLDTYPGAATAYSLRQLRTGVSSVVRVRRSSDNTEADFTANEITNGTLVSWVGAGNGFVRTWYDQSGNNRHGQQSTSGSQPQIVSSGALLLTGGKPKITFSTQFLSLGTQTILNDQTSIHAVLQSVAGTSLAGLINYLSSPIDDPEIRIGAGNDIYSYLNGGYTYSYNAGLTAARKLVSQVLSPGVTDTLFINGSQVNAVTRAGALATACAEFTLGRYVTYNANRNGEIQELIVYTTGAGVNRAGIDANINYHFSIYS
jgi:hypothetical protein